MARTCQDHTGREFPSVKAMLQAWNITRSQYDNRLSRGWTLEQTLTTPVATTIATDHLGNEYQTERAMLKAYGVKYDLFHKRLAAGMSLKDTLTTPSRHANRDTSLERRTDHLGVVHKSQRKMCEAWNVNPTTFRNRIKSGMTVEQALTDSSQPVGPDGVTYPTREAMYAALGTTAARVHYVMQRKNMTFEQALLYKREFKSPVRYPVEYQGKIYANEKDLCDAAGINPATFRGRIYAGKSLTEALSTPAVSPQPITDPFGREYENIKAMCDAWHVTYGAYRYYIRKGCDPNEALKQTCIKLWAGQHIQDIKITGCVEFPWFTGQDRSGHEVIVNACRLTHVPDNETSR